MSDTALDAAPRGRGMAVAYEDLVGRILIALLFILAGIGKIAGPAPFLAHMAAHGVPGFLLPEVIALEIGCGFAVLLGVLVRPAALALATFCLATACLFHLGWSDHVERTMFFKDLAIAGGLFVLAGMRREASRLEDRVMIMAGRWFGR